MPMEYGNLTSSAEHGVLLLNAILTVRANEPASHSRIGWMNFTDEVIKKISDLKSGIVFLLWGKFAQDKQVLIDETRHYLLRAATHRRLALKKVFLAAGIFRRPTTYL